MTRYSGALAIMIAIAAAAPAFAASIHIVDGDTFRLDDERIRLLGIDAPETHSPTCLSEKLLGALATKRLTELLDGSIVIERHGFDKYRRTLAVIHVDGRDVGAVLVAEGYAREWKGHKVDWCSR